jgi:hypothetical protein
LAEEERATVFLIIIDPAEGDEYIVRVGHLDAQLKDLPERTASIHAVSIGLILETLRADAEAAGVILPERLTPKFGSPEYFAWRERIGGEPATRRARAAIKAREKTLALLAKAEAEAKLLRRKLKEEANQMADMARMAVLPDTVEQMEAIKTSVERMDEVAKTRRRNLIEQRKAAKTRKGKPPD